MKKQILCAMLVLSSLMTSMSFAGSSRGPGYAFENVRALSTDVFNRTFIGGQTAIISVDGDGDTDLDLYVFDENGNLVDSDTDSTDYCVAVFTPRWTGSFTIKIVNRGSISNNYSIETN